MEPRRAVTLPSVKRATLAAAGLGLIGIAALQAAPAVRDAVIGNSGAVTSEAPATTQPQTAKASAPKAAIFAPSSKVTPMADRVAIVGLLNKRNGLWRDLTLKPGQAVRIGDVVVRLRACETTAPWEPEQLTGAFVQLLVNDTDKKWRRYFSGWLFKESPSLNVVEHPAYDVWTKECRMKHADIGPDTTVVRPGEEPKAKRGDTDDET
jgi:hypothetical protein